MVFDLDGTLAESKSDLDMEMANLLRKLLERKKVAVIGGGAYKQFRRQFLSKLRAPRNLLENLFLFPTTSMAFYRYSKGGWRQVYIKKLTGKEKKGIREAFKKTFEELCYSHPKKVYGQLIEDRVTQVSFSALGQKAPIHLKDRWKKQHTPEKLKIAKTLQKHLPNLEVRAAGYTTIDITHKGIDKEYGIRQIKKYVSVSFKDMIFIGDALFAGGNDSAALRTGIPCFAVDGPDETKKLIRALLSNN